MYGRDELASEPEFFFEGGIEIEDIVEIFNGICWLGAHPFVLYHEVDYFPEIAGIVYVPTVEYKFCEPAVPFDGHLTQPLAEGLTVDVIGFMEDVFGSVTEAFVDKPYSVRGIPAVLVSNMFKPFFHRKP
jgi:hypothetical protein